MPTYYDPNSEIHNTVVELKFTVDFSADKKTIVVRETTGIYDATSNPTGWDAVHAGGDDASIDQIGVSVVRAEFPNGNVYDALITGGYSVLPGTDGLGSVILGPTDFADGNGDPYVGTEFPEGAYSFYTLYTIADTDTAPNLFMKPGIVRMLFAPTSEGYVQEVFSALKPGCSCKSSEFEKAKLIDLYYKAAEYAAESGDNTKVDEYLAYVAKLSNKTVGCISC